MPGLQLARWPGTVGSDTPSERAGSAAVHVRPLRKTTRAPRATAADMLRAIEVDPAVEIVALSDTLYSDALEVCPTPRQGMESDGLPDVRRHARAEVDRSVGG